MFDGFVMTEWFRKAKIEWTISLDNEGTEQNFDRRCDWAKWAKLCLFIF